MPALPDTISPTVEAIYRHYENRPRHDRAYLGMSEIGAECERAIWYRWRWAHETKFKGRLLRLFETGNREEARLLDNLKAVGIEVLELDPTTGQQWSVEAARGHFRGHLDAIATGFLEAPKADHVVECKTHNEKSFAALARNGVENSKPEHFAQMQCYMHFKGINRAFYIAQNKNDDQIYVERIHYDPTAAAQLEAKAERIIDTDSAPPRLHEDIGSRAAFACQWCPALQLCHEGTWARVNCRTCLSASFEDGGVVRCTLTGEALSSDNQQKGCGKHLYLPSLVPGEQADANPAKRTVTYNLKDGSTWIDGGKHAA